MVTTFNGNNKEAIPDAGAVMAECKQWGITADLKQHQAEGVTWLITRYMQGVNVILGTNLTLS